MRILRDGLLVMLVLLAAGSAAAQSGGLRVIVYGDGDEPMPGATVTLSSARAAVAPTSRVTDAKGIVLFPVLRVGGEYIVEIAMPGFARLRLQQLRVRSDEIENVPVQLVPELRDTVTVRSRRDVVDLEKSSTSSEFGNEFIQNMPVPGRFYQNLLSLAPGVNDADGDGNPNVHGARNRDFQALVGGVNNVDPLTGQWLNYVNAESIEEIQVITAGAGVEFGRAQGGFARVVQKQGSNDFEGLFSFLFRSSLFDRDGAASLPANQIPDFDWLQPAIQLSGPIIRDRLWYRLSHEHVDREDPINLLNSIAVTRRRQSLNADQITWQSSPRNKLTFQFQTDPLRIENFDVSSAVPPESSRTLEHDGETYSINWIAPYSPNLLFDSLISYQDTAENILPSRTDVEQECLVFSRFTSLNQVQCLNTDINVTSGPFPVSSRDQRQRLTVRGSGTWFLASSPIGAHRLKFGFVVENERYYRELERRPFMAFSTERPLFPPPSIIGTANVTVPFPRATAGRTTGTNWGLYLEDQLRPHHTLAITAGVRFDREEIVARGYEPFDPVAEREIFLQLSSLGLNFSQAAINSFTAYEDIRTYQFLVADTLDVPVQFIPIGASAIQSSLWLSKRRVGDIDIANSNLSPRLSIAWDPWGDGKTKFAVSVGRYYDKIFLAIPLIEQEPVETEFTFMGFPIPPAFSPLFAVDVFFNANPTVRSKRVDHALRTPYQDELTVTAERALWTETSVKLTYVRRDFEDQFQDTDINHVGDNNQVINPGWGEILLVGNFNTSEYRAFLLELVRRLYHGWEMQLSYIRSEGRGDAEDYDQLLGNLKNLAEAERGFLAYDQRHVVRLNAFTLTPWGLRIGGAVRWQSGLPFSVLGSTFFRFTRPAEYLNFGSPGSTFGFRYPTGKRNDQRNASYWNVDLRLAKEFSLARDRQLQITAEVFNVLNEDTLIETDRIDGVTAGIRRFGRQYQIGVRLAF